MLSFQMLYVNVFIVYGPLGSFFINMDQLKSQHEWVITSIVKSEMKWLTYYETATVHVIIGGLS